MPQKVTNGQRHRMNAILLDASVDTDSESFVNENQVTTKIFFSEEREQDNITILESK